MASPAMKLSIFLLLALFSSLPTHARDSQLFNKIPSTTTTTTTNTNNDNVVVPTNQQDPNFLPENENSYGLYSQETGQNPPSTAAEYKQPLNKYLPKNYNPVAYVTQPESEEERTFTTNPNNNNNNDNEEENRNSYYSGEENYYNNQQQLDEAEFRSYPTTTTTTNRDNGVANYYLGSSFNSGPAFRNTFQPQGMSDTRHLEGGKYFYDVNSEKYSSNHPYETLKAARPQNDFTNTNFYGNNAYEEHFQDEENMP
ncbi:protein E6-like [Salvia hispanica]|uniref:protein E6-like n=1 Tax=Salvia hispanica TaxID=49212 RepID=UPI002009962A|nr:protein E6-like [Salvia hispanica]